MVEIVKNLMRIKTYEPSHHFAKIQTNEREISSLLEYFSQRVQYILFKDTNKRARNIKLA